MKLLDKPIKLYKFLFIGIFIGIFLTSAVIVYLVYIDKLTPIQISLRGQLFTVTTCADPKTNVQFDLECPLNVTLKDILELKSTEKCDCDCKEPTEVNQETEEKQTPIFEEIKQDVTDE